MDVMKNESRATERHGYGYHICDSTSSCTPFLSLALAFVPCGFVPVFAYEAGKNRWGMNGDSGHVVFGQRTVTRSSTSFLSTSDADR
jgi:hypothetical protein